jgi:hypothetical protein
MSSDAGDRLRAAAACLSAASIELSAARAATSDDAVEDLSGKYVETIDGLEGDFRDLADLADREVADG